MKLPTCRFIFFFSIAFFLSSAVISAPVSKVIDVIDGDTLKVVLEGRSVRVRLHEIDYPETGQRYGREAKKIARRLAYGKVGLVGSRGSDRYGRIIGRVILPGGEDLSLELVKMGACWWYEHYAPEDEELEHAQHEARSKKWGLWKSKAPLLPWKWRRMKKKKSLAFPN